jgi:hypothetical protein
MPKASAMVSRKQSSAELYLNEQHKQLLSSSNPSGQGLPMLSDTRKSRLKKNYSLQENLKSSRSGASLDPIHELIDDLNCNCGEHAGVIRLNEVFNLESDYLYNCLFGYNEFHVAFSTLRKISG